MDQYNAVKKYVQNMYSGGILIQMITIFSIVYGNIVMKIFPNEDDSQIELISERLIQSSYWWSHKYHIYEGFEAYILITQRYYQIQDFIPVFLENYAKYFIWHILLLGMSIQQQSFITDYCSKQKPAIIEFLLFTNPIGNSNSCGNIYHHYASQNTNFLIMLILYSIYIFITKKLKVQLILSQVLIIVTLITSFMHILQISLLKLNVSPHLYFMYQSSDIQIFFMSATFASYIFQFDYRKEDFVQQLKETVENTIIYKKLFFLREYKGIGDIFIVMYLISQQCIYNTIFSQFLQDEYSFVTSLRIIVAKFLYYFLQCIGLYVFIFQQNTVIITVSESFTKFYENVNDFIIMMTNAVIVIQQRHFQGYEFGPSSIIINVAFSIGITFQIYILSWIADLTYGKIVKEVRKQIRTFGNKTKIKYIRSEGRDDQ